MLASASAPVLVAVGAIGGAAAAVGSYLWLAGRERATSEQREADMHALTSTLGPAALTRSAFTDDAVRDAADLAVGSAVTIVSSTAFTEGRLGDLDTTSTDLHMAVWDVAHSLADVDARMRDWHRAAAAISAHSREQDRTVADSVREQITRDADVLFARAADLAELAAQALALQSRLAGPGINDDLSAALRPVRHSPDSPNLERLAGTISAASDVLDAEGLN